MVEIPGEIISLCTMMVECIVGLALIMYFQNILLFLMTQSINKSRLCFLTTGPEKFQTMHGNGCYNGACQPPIGKKVSAILLPKKDLSSESETPTSKTECCNETTAPWHSPLDEKYMTQISKTPKIGASRYKLLPGGEYYEITHFDKEGQLLFSELQAVQKNGTSGATATGTPKLLESPPLTREAMLSWLKTLSQPTK